MNHDETDIQQLYDRFYPSLIRMRKDIVITVLLLVIGAFIGLYWSGSILSAMLRLFHFEGIQVVMTSPYQFLDLSFSIALVVGILTASPYAGLRLYTFVRPALRREEHVFILRFLPVSILLFVVGFGFGLWIMQLVINVYVHLNTSYSISSFWDVSHFLRQILLTSFLSGVVFEIPIVISFLIRLHIFSYDDFAKRRKIVYAILVIIAILLPTTDLFSLVLETLPLFFLFEFGLLLNR